MSKIADNVVKFPCRKNVATGCESPMARGAKPHPARSAAFSFLATSFGGLDGEAQASPVTLRVPRSLTPIQAAARCESWSAVVHQAQLEPSMTHSHRDVSPRLSVRCESNPRTPAELEAAIVAQGAIAQALYRVGARTASVAAFHLLADLVAQRTPETVARMEAQRGLA